MKFLSEKIFRGQDKLEQYLILAINPLCVCVKYLPDKNPNNDYTSNT